ncbi:MAG: methyltransferase domain-containing protein [Thermoplasmata archaeon]|nr:methyltransferase domain-containing protein [Thermoplasmata archaeon]
MRVDREVPDFDRPSLMFRLEDVLKYRLLGERYYGRAVERLDLRGDEMVLDLGCGGGASSRCILRRLGDEGRLICLDTSGNLLGRARRRLAGARNVEFVGEDIRDAGLAEGSVDAVLVFHVIHDIPSRDRGPVALAIGRVMAPGGRLVVVEPTRASHGMSPEEVRHLLSEAGLTEEMSDSSGHHYVGLYRK